MGTLPQHRGTGTTFRSSPDARFAFNKSTVSRDSLLLCDLAKKTFKEIRITQDAWPVNWWDNENILCGNQANDLFLLDVISEKTSPLLYATNVVAFLDRHHVDHQDQRPSAFADWNGAGFEFYITDTHRKWLATNSFLLKIERPDARLSLVSTNFKFEWSDHFDESQRYYAYSGRDGRPVDGVFVREVRSGNEKTLVAPHNLKSHSLPNWHGTNVIYVWSNQLWSVDFNGVKKVCLFPPPE